MFGSWSFARGLIATASAFATLGCAVKIWGDALIVTRAMQASTVAEIFIETDRVRVELEIGQDDLAAFIPRLADRAPSAEQSSAALRAALEAGFRLDALSVADDAGGPLPQELVQVERRIRLVRDEVTGDPLPEQPQIKEEVLFAVVEFPFAGTPSELTFRLATEGEVASVGFVCYHLGLPINDFRYLPEQVTLHLDWTDPWYSRFDSPNLRRQYDAPASVFLYVQPFEVRQEVVIRPRDLQRWIDLGLEGQGVIRAERQAEIKRRVAEFLSEHNPLKIDGEPAVRSLDQVHFIRRSLRGSGVVDPPVDLDASSATLGVIFASAIDGLPQTVSTTWELFDSKLDRLPAVASDEAGGLPFVLTPGEPTLTWMNYLTNPTTPTLVDVSAPRTSTPRLVAVSLAAALVAGSACWLIASKVIKASRPGVLSAIAGLAALGAGSSVLAMPSRYLPSVLRQVERPADEEASLLVAGLLHNTYRAFDLRDEEAVYDRLAHSVDGELLSKIYLDTRRSMEIRNQGGLRVFVESVEVDSLDYLRRAAAGDFAYRCDWRVAGSVGHWGHIHQRVNRHLAELTIGSRDGAWKITGLRMEDEQLLSAQSVTAP